MLYVRRREFIAVLGASVAWPFLAGAQQAKKPPDRGALAQPTGAGEDVFDAIDPNTDSQVVKCRAICAVTLGIDGGQTRTANARRKNNCRRSGCFC